MKPLRPLVLVLLLSGLFSSARAQLVHISFSDFDGFFRWKTSVAGIPWDGNPGEIYQLDIYYDLATVTPSGGLAFDPARNFWQFKITGPYYRDINTVREPLENLSYHRDEESGWGQIAFDFWDPAKGYLDFYAFFHESSPSDTLLPLPPFDSIQGHIYSVGGWEGWFPYKNMGGSYGYGDLLSGSAEIVPYVGFRAVPEPATYGLGGLAVLSLVMLRRLRRKPLPVGAT